MNQITELNRTGFRWIGVGAIFGLLTIAFGAFGAHGMEDYFSKLAASDPALAAKRMGNWNTAAQYQMYHALALVLLGGIQLIHPSKLLSATAAIFCVGIVVFSGLLYCLVMFEAPILGAFVPIGGVSMMVGWLLVAIEGFRMAFQSSTDDQA